MREQQRVPGMLVRGTNHDACNVLNADVVSAHIAHRTLTLFRSVRRTYDSTLRTIGKQSCASTKRQFFTDIAPLNEVNLRSAGTVDNIPIRLRHLFACLRALCVRALPVISNVLGVWRPKEEVVGGRWPERSL